MVQIERLISGGQTGVDRGALEAALEAGIAIGGWCPPGREAEDGRISERFNLKETPQERSANATDVPRSLRTEWNVRDADATLILSPNIDDATDPGTAWTQQCCNTMEKAMCVVDPFDVDAIATIRTWLDMIKPKVLNVAGPSETKVPGIQQRSKQLISKLFKL